MKLSNRVLAIEPSPTLALNARALELRRKGEDVISFAVGEPDFDTPAHIKEAAVAAIREGFTKYTPASGIPELREAVARAMEREQGVRYASDEVIISTGAKQALYNAFQALCGPGDEVIIPAPYWVTYPEQAKMAGATPVIVPTGPGTGFKITPELLREVITPNSRVLVLNSPANPTGSMYSRDELLALAQVCIEHDLYVFSDEVYGKLVYDGGRHTSIAAVLPEMRERTIVVDGVSKAYAMTGWRIGWALGPRETIRAMGVVQGHATSNATSIAQKAALAALQGSQEPVRAMVEEFQRRRDYMFQRLSRMPGLTVEPAAGAFYLFPGIHQLKGQKLGSRVIAGDADLAELLLEEARVVVVPGSAFGCPDHLRLSYATSMENIAKGLDRLEGLLMRLG